MSFLLDTNVISEWVKARPNPGVIAWLAGVDEDRVFMSVVTLAELRYGVERMAAASRRKERLDEWLRDELPVRFEGRILPISDVIAHAWGKVVARSEAAGRPIGAIDAFIAATVETYDFILVTRNASDFDSVVKSILNPWSGDIARSPPDSA
jgi:predicted nucleic acid-binding protein